MLIDHYIEQSHVEQIHSIDVPGSPQEVYEFIKRLDFKQSKMIRLLFWLRGIPRVALKLEGFEEIGFIKLAEKNGKEIVWGEAGKPWRKNGDLQALTPEQFRSFQESGFLKIAWNFHVDRTDKGSRVTTITRVYGTDRRAKRIFAIYWFFISPFSKWIRRIMLRMLKADVQAAIGLEKGGDT